MIGRNRALAALAISTTLSLSAFAAQAATMIFTGSATNIGSAPVPDAGCAPLAKVSFGPVNTSGLSNPGNFTYTQTHCSTGGPGPYSGGIFEYFFAQGDELEGTYSGLAALSGTPGLLNNTINLIVTGGTGRFLGGSGFITGVGTVDFRHGAPVQQLSLNGELNLPAIPEPASWIMMVMGFGGLGVILRSRRTQPTSRFA
jgi:hypothetical protein